MVETLAELERRLSSLSHGDEAILEIQEFCKRLKRTEARIAVWNCENAIVRRPIEAKEVAGLGYNTPDDHFVILQADLVRTEAAYFFGQRMTGLPKYAVLNSSCDLVPGRTLYSSLLLVVEIRKEEEQAREKLSLLLKFKRRDSMYIPPLPDAAADVIANVMHFDGICQIRTHDLLLANRIASLSLVGWRIFAPFARGVLMRANRREVAMRTAVDTIPVIKS